MQKQFTENLTRLYQSVSKPMTDMTELNINTLNNWSKNKGQFEELTQAKKPEDLLMAQMKIANMSQLEAISYAKKAGDIYKNAIEQFTELCNDIAHDTTAKTSEVIRSGHKTKE
jgi:hypothetical protein